MPVTALKDKVEAMDKTVALELLCVNGRLDKIISRLEKIIEILKRLKKPNMAA